MSKTPDSYLELALEFLGTVGFVVFVIMILALMI